MARHSTTGTVVALAAVAAVAICVPAIAAQKPAPAKAEKSEKPAEKKAPEKKADEKKPEEKPFEAPVDEALMPPGPKPYQMMRDLRQLQDRIAQGDAAAIVRQRQMTEAMAEAFEKADDVVWTDPRNGRAVLALSLSGGDPKTLRSLLLRGQPKSIDVALARGIHAFASGRRGEALEYFTKLDPLQLDPSIAGQVALAQSELAARTDPAKALERLDQARLLAPGTLIEEAALRRQVGLLSAQKDFARADKLTQVYFRRFSRSAYATTLKRQITRFATERPVVSEHATTDLLVEALEQLNPRDRLEMYLEIAREAVAKARRDLVMFASEGALQLARADTVFEARAKVYINSMHAASLDAAKARADLEELKGRLENKEDLEIIAAAQSIADEIHKVGTLAVTEGAVERVLSL